MTSLLSVCWTVRLLRMILVIVIVFLLIIVIWCLLIFYNKLALAIFVLCGWCLWWSQTLEGKELRSQRDNVGIYFERKLCFVINSSLVGSLTLFYWACKSHREKFTIVFINKLMELSLKIEMSHFIVSEIVATRRVVTVSFWLFPSMFRSYTQLHHCVGVFLAWSFPF